jgi:hypothetical protein
MSPVGAAETNLPRRYGLFVGGAIPKIRPYKFASLDSKIFPWR